MALYQRRTQLFLLGVAALFALFAVGCSEDTETASASATAGAATATSTPASSPEPTPASENIAIAHALGTLELEAPAQRVVVLEWVYAEDLVALGLEPVGVSDTTGYAKWVAAAPLGASVADVGTRQEPNLEAIAELKPDLIIGVQFRHEAIYEQLSAIAPTLLFNPYPADFAGQHDEMLATFEAIAAATGRAEQGVEVLAELEAHYTEAASTLSGAGLDVATFVLMQGYSAQEAPVMRLFTDNALAVQILEAIGLDNAIESDPQLYGFIEADVEGLVPYGDAHLIYIVQDDDNIVDEFFQTNPIWSELGFVQEDRTHALGGDAWTFGGPLSAKVIVDRVVALLTGA